MKVVRHMRWILTLSVIAAVLALASGSSSADSYSLVTFTVQDANGSPMAGQVWSTNNDDGAYYPIWYDAGCDASYAAECSSADANGQTRVTVEVSPGDTLHFTRDIMNSTQNGATSPDPCAPPEGINGVTWTAPASNLPASVTITLPTDTFPSQYAPTAASAYLDSEEQQLVTLIDQWRANNGRPAVQVSTVLDQQANGYAQIISAGGAYNSCDSPTNSTEALGLGLGFPVPSTYTDTSGDTYGPESIYGQASSEDAQAAFDAWAGDTIHAATMAYSGTIGVSYYNGYWVLEARDTCDVPSLPAAVIARCGLTDNSPTATTTSTPVSSTTPTSTTPGSAPSSGSGASSGGQSSPRKPASDLKAADLKWKTTNRVSERKFKLEATLKEDAQGVVDAVATHGSRHETFRCERTKDRVSCVITLAQPGRWHVRLRFTAADHTGWKSGPTAERTLTAR